MLSTWIYVLVISNVWCQESSYSGLPAEESESYKKHPTQGSIDDSTTSGYTHSSSSCKWNDAPENAVNFMICDQGECKVKSGTFSKNGTRRITRCDTHHIRIHGNERDVCHNGKWSSTGHKCVPLRSTYQPSVKNKECTGHENCPDNKRCVHQTCLDMCPGACGNNSVCRMNNHSPVCACIPGYTGNPYDVCTREENENHRNIHRTRKPAASNISSTPITTVECTKDAQCPDNRKCVRQTCLDMCPGACGTNSVCRMDNHSPVCTCSPGYKGNSYDSCTKEESASKENEEVSEEGCLGAEDCATDNICLGACEAHYRCEVKKRAPFCYRPTSKVHRFSTNAQGAPHYMYDRFFPASGNSFIKFKVKANSDAMLLISESGYQSTLPYLEVNTYRSFISYVAKVVIGGSNNTVTAVRGDRTRDFSTKKWSGELIDTPQILGGQEFRSFWLLYSNRTIYIGQETKPKPFYKWRNLQFPDVQFKFFSVTTFSSKGEWEVYGAGCESSYECEQDVRVCRSGACVDPCRNKISGDTCSLDSFCQYGNHIASCIKSKTVQRLNTNPKGYFSLDYTFFPTPRDSLIRFKVKAPNEVHVVLSEFPHTNHRHKHEIVLAGGKFGGTMILDSFFTVGSLGHDMAAYPDDILSPDNFHGFWIRSSGHKTEVGRENEVKPIISLPYTNFPNFKFFGVGTYGSPGQWIIHGAGCTHSDECGENSVCEKNTGACVDPCKGTCENSFCRTQLRTPSCFNTTTRRNLELSTNSLSWLLFRDYELFTVPENSIIRFKVKAEKEALILLSGARNTDVRKSYTIILGSASNTKTEIKQVSYQPGSVYETPNILRRNELVGFWIKFKFGTFDIGREDEVIPFVSYTDPSPSFDIKYVGFSTSDSSGEWIVYGAGCMNDYECAEDRACDAKTGTCVDPYKDDGDEESFCEVKSHKTSCFKVANATKLITPPGFRNDAFLTFSFFRAPKNSIIRFKIKAERKAHIILTELKNSKTIYSQEVVLGFFGNTRSNVGSSSYKTPNILHEREFRGFWIKTEHGTIDVGREYEVALNHLVEPFMSLKGLSQSLDITVYGLATDGCTGEWIVYAPPKKKECTIHEHCPADKRCVGHSCLDACARLCNANSHCRIVNHIAVCRCNAGYKRIPYLGMEINAADSICVEEKGISEENDRQEAVRDDCLSRTDCVIDSTCVPGTCSDPCHGVCGIDNSCELKGQVPVCIKPSSTERNESSSTTSYENEDLSTSLFKN